MKLDDYAVRIEPLPRGKAAFGDARCVADGETVDVAIAEAHDAFGLWQGAGAEQLDKARCRCPRAHTNGWRHALQRRACA